MNNQKSKQPKQQSQMNRLQNLSYLESLSDNETDCVQGGYNIEYTPVPYPNPFPLGDGFIGGGPCIGEIPDELKGKYWTTDSSADWVAQLSGDKEVVEVSAEELVEKFREISKYVLCPPSHNHGVEVGLFK